MNEYLRCLLRGHRRVAHVLCIAAVLELAICASADVDNVRQNLDKYWLYRGIQRTDFLVPGIGQGRSLPASWRNPDVGYIKWADTTIDLGWYIGALATEHYMLSHPELYPGYDSGDSGALATARKELYYALSAINRLDSTAEACWDPAAKDAPGFFIRDDVPVGFYSHFAGFTSSTSDYTEVGAYMKEMSQDQAVHVLLGLSLVKKLVPSGVVVNGLDLRQSAITRGSSIVDWIRRDGWFIKNPVTKINVNRGPDCRGFSTGYNKTGVYLTDGAMDFSSTITGLFTWAWGMSKSPLCWWYGNENNLHMAMTLAATGNGWGDADTLDTLMGLAHVHNWYVYPLLYASLYDPVPQSLPSWMGYQLTLNNSVQDMLNLAPATATPHDPADPSELNTGWCACRRFLGSIGAQNGGQNNPGEQNNGSDYLVLHNLFYIVSPSMWQDPRP